MPFKPSDYSMVDVLEEVAPLIVGLGIIIFALFPLALPMIALTLVLAIPLVAVVLVESLLIAPIVLVRRLRERGPGAPPPAPIRRATGR